MTDTTDINVITLKTFVGAQDYELSRRFYEALGWSVSELTPDLSEARFDGKGFFLQRYYQRDWCNNSMMFMDVGDTAAWRRRIDDLLSSNEFGAARVKGPSDEGYALVTHMWDPSGVLWHIAQAKA